MTMEELLLMGHIVFAMAFGMAKTAKVSLKIVLPEIKGRSQIEGSFE